MVASGPASMPGLCSIGAPGWSRGPPARRLLAAAPALGQEFVENDQVQRSACKGRRMASRAAKSGSGPSAAPNTGQAVGEPAVVGAEPMPGCSMKSAAILPGRPNRNTQNRPSQVAVASSTALWKPKSDGLRLRAGCQGRRKRQPRRHRRAGGGQGRSAAGAKWSPKRENGMRPRRSRGGGG